MGFCATFCIVLITIFIPPLGVFLISGCTTDLLVNIVLTFLGYIPGHIHAFYLEYQYYKRRDIIRNGGYIQGDAPFIFSRKIQTGGRAVGPAPPAAQPPPQGQPGVPQQTGVV